MEKLGLGAVVYKEKYVVVVVVVAAAAAAVVAEGAGVVAGVAAFVTRTFVDGREAANAAAINAVDRAAADLQC